MQGIISGRPQLNRKINASIVLNLLQKEGAMSRADLAKQTGIRSTSISAIVEQLLEENLVREVGRGKSTGGRHPILLEINPAGLYAAGIEIAENELNGVVVDLSGKTLAAESIPMPDTTVETISKKGDILLDRLSENSGVPRDMLSSVGVALPGIITKGEGRVVLSNPLGWTMVPLKGILTVAWKAEVHVLNNAMAGAMAESFGGVGQGTHSLLYVLTYLRSVRQYALTSIGCGIVLDGRAYFGEGQTAGEIRADIPHPLALADDIFGDEAPQSIDEILSGSRENPEKFAPLWDEFAKHFGQVIAWGMDFLSPGRVVIGTDVLDLDEFIGDRLREMVHHQTVAGIVADLPEISDTPGSHIFFAPLRQDTVARGAIVPRLQELSLAPLLRESVLS